MSNEKKTNTAKTPYHYLKSSKEFFQKNLIYIWLISEIIALIYCYVTFEKNSGLLFSDMSDVAMDHFNSIFATVEKQPYLKFHITYPPLAAMFYYFFGSCINPNIVNDIVSQYPEWNKRAVREHSTALVPYMMHTIIFTLVLAIMIFKKYKGTENQKIAFTFASIMSVGFIYTIDRGNNNIVAMCFTLYYILNYDSENKILSESALIALAIATGLKLYPIIFGVLLIRHHKIWKGFRAVLYIILALVLPFFFFEGFAGMKFYFKSWFGFYSSNVVPIHPGALNFVSAINNLEVAFKIDIPDFLVRIFPPIFKIAGTIFAITFRKDYKAMLFSSLAIIAFSGVTFEYFLVFLLIPVFYLFANCRSAQDKIYAISLVILLLPLNLPTPSFIEGTGIFLPQLIRSMILLVMEIFILIDGAIDFCGYIKNKRWKYLFKTEKQFLKMSDVPVWEE